MQKNSIINIIKFVIENPTRIPILVDKIFSRIKEHNGKTDINWLVSQQTDFHEWATNTNQLLWQESIQFAEELRLKATQKLNGLPFSMGGGGIYPVLYFITRYYQPLTLLETGVAAGYSTQAFLSAIKINNKGTLYSSDFPYFRVPNPEKYIGILVDENLKNNWNLYMEGDSINLPYMLKNINSIDLFHYDSDKSYGGREKAWDLVKHKVHPATMIIFDDIQDNNYFKHFIEKHHCKYHIFNFQTKFVGFVYTFTN